MPKRATIVDVARHAGVSKSTVSLVLQNSSLVKASTRAAVEQSIQALGYVYNRSAARLRSTGAGLVGLIVNDIRNPFFTEFAASAQMALALRGYATVIANTDEDPALQAQVIGTMIEHGVDGLLISPAFGGDANAFDRIAAAGTPALQVLRQVDERTGLFPFASLDYATGSRLATEHLLQQGARGLAFVGGIDAHPITAERRGGFERVTAAEGLTPVFFHGRPTRAFGRAIALEIARQHPRIEAAVCFNDLVAHGMIAGFAQCGKQVGRDFRLVGFDDIEESALSYPTLSSVRCHIARFGRQSAETLLRWLQQHEPPAPRQREAVELIARQSSLGI